MLKKKLLAVALAAPLVWSLASIAPAYSADAKAESKTGNKGQNVDPAKKGSSPQADAVAAAAVADQLIRYGDKNKDAMSLITAARMLKQVGVRDEKREKKTEGKAAGAGKAAAEARDRSVDGILARAKEYAGGRKDLIALADEAAKEGSRGAVQGPIRHRDNVRARATDTYRIAFRGGEPAIIFVSGDGDTDLDLVVTDENGGRICVANGPGDDERCRWTPKWTGEFNVRVVNTGNESNTYRLLTN